MKTAAAKEEEEEEEGGGEAMKSTAKVARKNELTAVEVEREDLDPQNDRTGSGIHWKLCLQIHHGNTEKDVLHLLRWA